ncbi:MAG: transposase [Desulfovibrio sp.]|nr:transposase [Desulfovibrio sp.]
MTLLFRKRQFNKIRSLFPARKRNNLLDDRKVSSAIILVIRHRLPWRNIPEFYGNWI